MPNNKNIKSVERLTEKISKAKSIYFTDYLGLNVSDITKLRKEFFTNDVEYLVVKNTLLKIASENNKISLSEDLGIISFEEGVCLRATFIVDPEQTIQHVSVNALDTGRNVDEIIRTLKALQAGGLTGCSWQEGDEFVA